jgi:hypothetical protein
MAMNASLHADPSQPPVVLLAAGRGSRYGGVKPLAPVGVGDMPLLVVELHQAARAGFTRAVVVTGALTHDAIVAALAEWPLPLVVETASQDGMGPPRDKPWGTVAAVLAGSGREGGVIANGDDLYGHRGFAAATAWSQRAVADRADAAVIAYRLGATVPAVGTVNRGVLTTTADGRLIAVHEHRHIARTDDGFRSDLTESLAADALVSMNLMVFTPHVTALLADRFDAFIAAHHGDAEAECLLSNELGSLLASGAIGIDVVETDSVWHGVTYAHDVPVVRAALAREND